MRLRRSAVLGSALLLVRLGTAVAQAPPEPVPEIQLEGRSFHFSAIQLNGRGRCYEALPGERLDLRFDWVSPCAGSCGPTRSLWLGVHGGVTSCFSESISPDTTAGAHGAGAQLRAPGQPGTYYVTVTGSEASCAEPPARTPEDLSLIHI